MKSYMIISIISIICTLLSLVGCGTELKKKFWIEPQMQSYYDSFITEANHRGILWNVDNLELFFVNDLGIVDTDTKRLGICRMDNEGTPVIEIDEGDFKELPDKQREVLIYHELGHCLLNRDHDNSSITKDNGDLIPTSIMNESLLSNNMYSDNYSYYVEELI